MSASERLEFRLSLARPALQLAAAQMWDCAPPRLIYPAYLQTMHMVVRSAVPLLEAAAKAASELRNDPLGSILATYFSHHANEERGHDGWIISDIKATDAKIDDPRGCFPPPCVAEMVGTQYYWIRHFHPVTLIGHVAAMETLPPPPGFAEFLQGATNFPSNAFTAIRRHAILDVAHASDLYQLIDQMPLSASHEAAISASALHTIERGIDLLSKIASDVGRLAGCANSTHQVVPEIA